MMSTVGLSEIGVMQLGTQSVNPSRIRKISRETIHSGHFMVSELDDNEANSVQATQQAAHESDYEQPEVVAQTRSYDLESACKETTQSYPFGPSANSAVQIDGSLTKLFECMSLAYSGKITSPRWKTFKGLKLKLKDKIRLNNIIWRAWHIQYISGKKPLVCQFSSPIDPDTHNKPEAVILEGKYWKRRLTTVTAEYKKWRMYYKEKGLPQLPLRPSSFDWENRWPSWASTNSNSMSSFQDSDFMDFTDTLFSTIGQTIFDFPNPREIARAGMVADFIQPGLAQLQPTLDDFMDTFEPLQDLLMQTKNTSLPTLPEETESSNTTTLSEQNAAKDTLNMATAMSEADIFHSLLSEDTNKNSSISSATDKVESSVNATGHNSMTENCLTPIHRQYTTQVQNCDSLSPFRSVSKQLQQQQLYTSMAASNPEINRQQTQVQMEVPSQTHSLQSLNQTSYDSRLGFRSNDSNNSVSSYLTKTTSVKPEYFSPSQPVTSNKFAVPKPPKQRTRSRSSSSPGKQKQVTHTASLPVQTVASLNDVTLPKPTSSQVERSTSLPVYTQERKRGPSMHNNSKIQAVPTSQLYAQGMTQIPVGTSNQLQQLISSSSQPVQQSNFVTSYNNSYTPNSSSTLIQLLAPNSAANVRNLQFGFQNSSINRQIPSQVPHTSQQEFSLSNTSTIDANCVGLGVSSMPDNKSQILLSPVAFDNASSLGNVQSSLMHQISNEVAPMTNNPHPTTRVSPVASPSKEVFNVGLSTSPSASKNLKPKSVEERIQYREHRRVCHINAEQKRRCNIKNGFDTLRGLLPSISQNANTKISKAAMLQKAAEYIRALKIERQKQTEEYDMLKQQIESLNQTIGVFQNQLPATGAPVACQRSSGQSKEMFENYVKMRTLQNWKFWIFSIIFMEPLLESYTSSVATTNVDEMRTTLLRWLDQNCSLVTLRRDVLNSLRYLSTSTNILTTPSSLPDEAVLAVTKKEKQID